jgi:hypothetical protein
MPQTAERITAWVTAHRRAKALREQYHAKKAEVAALHASLLQAEAELDTAARDLAAD